MPVKVTVKQSGRVRAPKLEDPQMKIIGDAVVAAQKARWAKGFDTLGQKAKALSVKYFFQKRQIRKINNPIRDMHLSGGTIENFTLRRASENQIRAENTTREMRKRASGAQGIWEMIGFAGSDVAVAMKGFEQQYDRWALRAFIPIVPRSK